MYRAIILSLVSSCILMASTETLYGQVIGVRQTIDDYRQPTQYSPDDPWIRSTVFRQHVGYYGRFFNSDCEESKRYSPYIQWKTVDNRQCQPGPLQSLRTDLNKLHHRIQSAR